MQENSNTMGKRRKRKVGNDLRNEMDSEAADLAISARLIGVSSTTQRHKRSKLERYVAEQKRLEAERGKQEKLLRQLKAPMRLKSKDKKYLFDILGGSSTKHENSESDPAKGLSINELIKLRKKPKLKDQKKKKKQEEEQSAFTEKDFENFIRGFKV